MADIFQPGDRTPCSGIYRVVLLVTGAEWAGYSGRFRSTGITNAKDFADIGWHFFCGSEFDRDFGRAVFSTPSRRLQDKAKVFPLEAHDGVERANAEPPSGNEWCKEPI